MKKAVLWSLAILASVCTTAVASSEPPDGRARPHGEAPPLAAVASKQPDVVQVPHKLDEVVGRIVEARPVDYRMFSAIGASRFHQVGESDSLNISLRSDPTLAADGYAFEYLEYRAPPGLIEASGLVLLQTRKEGCYPAGPLREKYGFEWFVTPPNPHAPNLPPPDAAYVGYVGGNELMLWASPEGDCVRGLWRSGS